MGTPSPFVTVARVIGSDDRSALIMTGTPSRPVLVPIAVADFEPLHDHEPGAYRLTMDRDTAKELGLDL